MTGRADQAAWYDIYLAAAAVDAVCVRRGMWGVAGGLGMLGRRDSRVGVRADLWIVGLDGSLTVSLKENIRLSASTNVTSTEVS